MGDNKCTRKTRDIRFVSGSGTSMKSVMLKEGRAKGVVESLLRRGDGGVDVRRGAVMYAPV